MRLRLGLLHDADAQQRMHEREKKAAEERQKKTEVPTVRTEEEQRKYLEQLSKDRQKEKDGKKEEKPKVKIRPLSDARAIELGANFFSEAFIFAVAVGLLLAENYRSSRKASNRRDEVADRLSDLETEVERLKKEHDLPELEALNERIKKSKEAKASWYNPLSWFRSSEADTPNDEEAAKSQDAKVAEGASSTQASGAPSHSVAQKPLPATTTSSSKKEGDEEAHGAPRIDTVKAAQKQR